jgi:hypothetical protein
VIAFSYFILVDEWRMQNKAVKLVSLNQSLWIVKLNCRIMEAPCMPFGCAEAPG